MLMYTQTIECVAPFVSDQVEFDIDRLLVRPRAIYKIAAVKQRKTSHFLDIQACRHEVMGSYFHSYCNLDILSSSRLRYFMDLAGDPLRAPLSMAHMHYNTQNQYHHMHITWSTAHGRSILVPVAPSMTSVG